MSPAEILIRAHLTAQGIARTWQLALRCGQPTDAMRRILLRLERRGVVARCPDRSAVNDICWVLADQAATEVKAA